MRTLVAAALLATAAAVAPAAAGASADDGAAQAPDYAKLKSSLYELANSSLASVGSSVLRFDLFQHCRMTSSLCSMYSLMLLTQQMFEPQCL